MASLLSFFLGEKNQLLVLPKERLSILLAHERAGRNALQPEKLMELQRELVAVISKYVKVNPSDIKVIQGREDNLETLEVKIELPESR